MIFERGPQIFLTIDLSHFPFKKLLFYQENSTNSLAKGMTDRFCTVVGIAKLCPKNASYLNALVAEINL